MNKHTRARLLGSTALAAAAIVMAAPSASAQDLSALEKRVVALEKSQKEAYVHRSKKAMKLTVSGHVNRLVQYRDAGGDSGVVHITPITSRSRVRWIGDGKISDDISVRTLIELGNRSASGSQTSLVNINNGSANQDPLDERHIDIVFTSKTMGKLWIGQGPTATEGTSERDLSGTALITLNGSFAPNNAGAEQLFVNGVATGNTVGQAFNSFDGDGRQDRIRYDTPSFGGFSVAVDHQNGDDWGAALRYAGAIGGAKVEAAFAYSNDNTGDSSDQLNGSASILLPFGLSLTAGWANVDFDAAGRDDAEWLYGKIGYRFKALEMGETRLVAEWSQNKDRTQNIDGDYYGVALIQILEPLGAELQFGYHNIDVELANGVNPDDVHVVSAGVRVSF